MYQGQGKSSSDKIIYENWREVASSKENAKASCRAKDKWNSSFFRALGRVHILGKSSYDESLTKTS